MAQSANMIDEPTMDDILASIREIIEENTAFQVPEHFTGTAPLTDVAKVANTSFKSQQTVAQAPKKGVLNPKPNTADQDALVNRLRAQVDVSVKEILSVDEAMNALARRIGLSLENDEAKKQVTAPVPHVQVTPPPPKQENPPNAVREEPVKTDRKVISSTVQTVIAEEKIFEQAEDLVDEILRPILRKWLEKNLQPMVERILREEVTKSLKSMR